MRTPARPAFTLVEVLLVVLLIGLLAAVVWPDFGPFSRGRQLPESAERIKALVAMCRAQAMNEARTYRISIQADGRLRVTRQLDPLLAPQEYVRVRDSWTDAEFLMEDVWVEAVLPLPDGPPPILVEDDTIEFNEFVTEPVSVTELTQPLDLDFSPDGSCASARWILRDVRGHGLQMTLDGRLGRLEIVEVEPRAADDVEKPPLLPVDKELDEKEAALEKELREGRL